MSTVIDFHDSEVDHSDDESNSGTFEDIRTIEGINDEIYNVNIFKISASDSNEFVFKIPEKQENLEFKVEAVVNGSLAVITTDTGARVCVCGEVKWKLTS